MSAKIFSLKRENPEHILIVKIIDWMKSIDCFGLSIEADPSRVGKKNVYFVYIFLYQALNLERIIYRWEIWKNS